jgi:hypothetical protein
MPYDYIAIKITTGPANNMIMPHAPLNSEKAPNHISQSITNLATSLLSLTSTPLEFYSFHHSHSVNPFTALGYCAPHFFSLTTSTKVVPSAPKPPWTNHFLGSHLNCIPRLDV